MIARVAHSANWGLSIESAPISTVDGVDLASTVSRIIGWGGDGPRYSHFLARGMAVAPPTAASARAVGVLAGWRSGVVNLREEALRRVGEVEQDAAAASLGLEPEALGAFLTAQTEDPFAWLPGEQHVARIGGFSGFGGSWLSPPTTARFVSPTAIDVRCGTEQWLAVVDVFGAHITRSDAAKRATFATPTARALVSEDSYLVEIVRGAK